MAATALKNPYPIPKKAETEAKDSVSKSYWEAADRRVSSPPIRKAAAQFLKTLKGD